MASGSTVALTDVRQYGLDALIAAGSNAIGNPTVDGKSYGSNAMGPMSASFGVEPEIWARYWAFFEPQSDGQLRGTALGDVAALLERPGS